MPDYYSTSLWPESESSYEEFESPIRYESLNLSSDLIKDLKAFDNSILNILDWNDLYCKCFSDVLHFNQLEVWSRKCKDYLTFPAFFCIS